jgi:hypothetical protein
MSQKDEAGGDEPAGGDFVSRLVDDPAKPPQTTLLSGYVGASDEEGHTRIYFDPQLSDYVDVADDDVLHTEPSGGPGPLSPTLVWIKRDAQVLHGQAGSTRQRAGFFEGRVWRENFGVTVAGGPGAQGPRRRMGYGPPPPRPLSAHPCPSVVGCRTPVHPCAGPISANPCPTVQACRTRAPFCAGPSAVDACPTARCVTQGCNGPEGSSGGDDNALQGSGEAGADTVVQGSGGTGADTVNYGSGGGADTVNYGSGGGTDTVSYGSGGGADTVNYGSGGGSDTVFYGSGGGADTVHYGLGGGAGTVRYGGPAILPTEWCPSAGLPCPPRTLACPPPTFGCPPRTVGCPPRTFGCPPPTFACPPRTARCPRTLGPFCPNPSAVDACPTRFCPPG